MNAGMSLASDMLTLKSTATEVGMTLTNFSNGRSTAAKRNAHELQLMGALEKEAKTQLLAFS
jgi:hypothetical protein